MKPLTTTQQNVLAFITCFINNNRYSPSMNEIAGHFGYRSDNAAQCHVDALIKKKHITATKGASRSIVLLTGSDLDKFTDIELLKELVKRNDIHPMFDKKVLEVNIRLGVDNKIATISFTDDSFATLTGE